MRLADLPTPALVVDRRALADNVATMGARWPGRRLRPHVKAFKSTGLARVLADAGHDAFCAATPREVLGLAAAGLGADVLLANECLDPVRLRAMATCDARVTVAVDSDETLDAAADAGIAEVLIDVNVGLPRCGCAVDDAGRLADRARQRGLGVRGVMGYEGHVTVIDDAAERRAAVDTAMAKLRTAHDAVGGEVLSGGATMSWDSNDTVTELQAGTFTLMDTAFAPHVPFAIAVSVLATVISVNPKGYAVADAGLKSLGMDHGPPTIPGRDVWVCSDEHVTFAPAEESRLPRIGEKIRLLPAHLDPTVAKHELLHVVEALPAVRTRGPLVDPDAEVIDTWPVDLRGW